MPTNSSFARVSLGNASAAAERFFRLYEAHCVSPDPDTLFGLLEAAHSLNDRLKVSAGCSFLDLSEFAALKCLRNYFHHHEELLNTLRIIPVTGMPISTDLLFLCMVPGQAVEEAIEQVPEKYRVSTRDACQSTFHWYGSVVNINPCIFNFGVAVFEQLNKLGVPMLGDAVGRVRDLYEMEAEEGISHYVDGRITTSAATMSQLFADLAQTDVGA